MKQKIIDRCLLHFRWVPKAGSVVVYTGRSLLYSQEGYELLEKGKTYFIDEVFRVDAWIGFTLKGVSYKGSFEIPYFEPAHWHQPQKKEYCINEELLALYRNRRDEYDRWSKAYAEKVRQLEQAH